MLPCHCCLLSVLLQIHYGRASMTKLSRLPAFFVFPQQQLNTQAAAACLASSSLLADGGGDGGSCPVLIFVDQPLLHQLEQRPFQPTEASARAVQTEPYGNRCGPPSPCRRCRRHLCMLAIVA